MQGTDSKQEDKKKIRMVFDQYYVHKATEPGRVQIEMDEKPLSLFYFH